METDMPKDPRDGLWYWLVIARSSNYFLAKGLGGEAEEQADAALEDLGRITVGIGILAFIAGVIWLIGRMFGVW